MMRSLKLRRGRRVIRAIMTRGGKNIMAEKIEISKFSTKRLLAVFVLSAFIASLASADCVFSWKPLPWTDGAVSANGPVYAMTVYDGELISGGHFDNFAGERSMAHIGRWNGSDWQSLGGGLRGEVGPLIERCEVIAFTVYNGELIVGGAFISAGTTIAQNIASWDGASWQPLGNELIDPVFSLTVYNGELIAGGWFGVARWDGTSWQPLGSGVGYPLGVFPLTVYNGELIAGGMFGVARWDGTNWQPLGDGGISGGARVFCVYNGELVVGGGSGSAWAIWGPDCLPLAQAGPDQSVYAGVDGIADVTLNASDSNDPYGYALVYKWKWTIDGNTCQANGINPTIELPIGLHTVQLVVNNGLMDSVPDDVNVTVIAPLEVYLKITPQAINRNSNQPSIQALIEMPEGVTPNDVDISESLVLSPGDIAAAEQSISGGRNIDAVSASFDKNAVMAAVPNGDIKFNVAGKLMSGQYFYGTDTVKIIGQKPK
jgi:hypothetical protein